MLYAKYANVDALMKAIINTIIDYYYYFITYYKTLPISIFKFYSWKYEPFNFYSFVIRDRQRNIIE